MKKWRGEGVRVRAVEGGGYFNLYIDMEDSNMSFSTRI